jgi:hypothetical protein
MTLYGNFANYGFIKDSVPQSLFNKLNTEINELDFNTAERYNNNLAGNISLEFKLSKCHKELEQYVLTLCQQYEQNWDITYTRNNLSSNNLEMYVYWSNFQKKHEFNPMHTHDGIYSFVIWLKVPFYFQDEILTDMCKLTNMPRPGMFSFVYTNVFGESRESEFVVDRTSEGTIMLFPSALPHMVYPFSTADGYRISISGNIRKKQ